MGVSPLTPRKHPWIFSRTACLGTEILERLGRVEQIPKVYNFQKARIDYLTEALKESPKREVCLEVTRWWQLRKLVLSGSLPMVAMSLSRNLLTKSTPRRPPELMVIDDFSELTDQAFSHHGTSWFSHHSDLTEFAKKSESLLSHGLLPVETISSHYLAFFTQVFSKWPNVKVIFFVFPTYRESRSEFIHRSRIIRESLAAICLIFPLVSVVSAEDIDFTGALPILDAFPYHFPEEVYDYFVSATGRLFLPS